MAQANSCQDYFLSASVTPTSRPAAQRRLDGIKFIVNSHIPEGLPLRSNRAIYVSSSICVRYRERWRMIIGSIFGSLVCQVITLIPTWLGIQQKWMVLAKIVDKKWCCSSSGKISGFVQSFDWRILNPKKYKMLRGALFYLLKRYQQSIHFGCKNRGLIW